MADDRSSSSDSEDTTEKTGNKFANDGSFLEMFKKKMEEQKAQQDLNEKSSSETAESSEKSDDKSPSDSVSEKTDKKNISHLVGKRRGAGAKVLKTGIVKKPKQDEDEDSSENKDGWSKYLAEVNKYKAKICSDDDKTRPLVK